MDHLQFSPVKDQFNLTDKRDVCNFIQLVEAGAVNTGEQFCENSNRKRPLKNVHIVIASEAKQSHNMLIIQEIASSFHSSQ